MWVIVRCCLSIIVPIPSVLARSIRSVDGYIVDWTVDMSIQGHNDARSSSSSSTPMYSSSESSKGSSDLSLGPNSFGQSTGSLFRKGWY